MQQQNESIEKTPRIFYCVARDSKAQSRARIFMKEAAEKRRVCLCRAEEKAAGLRLESSWGGKPNKGGVGEELKLGQDSRLVSVHVAADRDGLGFGQLPTEVRVE
ncbi:uncharacterized protein LOC115564234 [Drosophila navojoa]|uniref:uncharacterized protein LOC115564234 n=1 Tax=Drosophila navojoa TaxID=7232 RepID=UPI0011BF3CDB|nr:uncharacterized protein LOC115564234 [Drosophila navojoa]